tara:strand:+ start:11 stop:838 length:828 start_codon:yes stop_codon:yes gene_type:complete
MDVSNKTQIGSLEIIALQDGELNLPVEVLNNLNESQNKNLNSQPEENPLTLSNINAFLIKNGNRNLLIDAGCRDLFGPTCGFLINKLSDNGISPNDITDLFFTHLHPDHVGGSITENGEAVFKNATVKLSGLEIDFWKNGKFEKIDVNGEDWSNLAKTVLNAYNKVETVNEKDMIIPDVHMVNLPGHTPGHSGFRIDSSGDSFIHLGDILHTPRLQLENPDVSLVFDVDMDQGLKTRKKMLDMVSNDKILCSSGHMLEPKFCYIEKSGTGYKLSY